MFVPCPLCGTTLSSEGVDRFCIYCDKLFNEMPVIWHHNVVSQSFFYDRRRPPKCKLAVDIKKDTVLIQNNEQFLLNGIHYEIGEENNTVFIVFLVVPEDGDYITVESEVER
jgi:hypothetical protein